jgi:hypothetical protein
MEYAHQEVIRELGITASDLPSEIKTAIRTWNNKQRLATKTETIVLLEGLSVDIADDIAAWHYANSDDEEEEEEEEEYDTESEREDEPLLVEKPVVVAPIVEQPQNIVSHVTNPEVVEEHKEEEKNGGWGLKNLSNW